MKLKMITCIASLVMFMNMAAQQPSQAGKVDFPKENTYKGKKLSYKIISTANNTFCYDIFSDDKLIIHQPSIPGVKGNEGFKTKDAAVKVAELVIGKLQKGQSPPSVTMDELKQLKAM